MPRKKMTIEEYCDTEFTPKSRPVSSTIVRWIQNGTLPGEKIGGKWWVYVQQTQADALVEKVLSA